MNHYTPNHLVNLTSRGHEQALQAALDISKMVNPGEKVTVYRSPYARTRETASHIENVFQEQGREVDVIEEPRLREQDFGNFQDTSLMSEVLNERSRYGSFFFRIPNGESAADVYDRCCSYTSSLHRHFEKHNPDVVIMVSHGIWGRVFLMKWFGWPYETFEDLKNLQYCRPIVMKRQENEKYYDLLTDLPTWSGVLPVPRDHHAPSP